MGTAIDRLGNIVRPFDQVELSLRWPMQSHFAWATKDVTTSLKNDKSNERPLHVALAAAMPLPVQRRSNAYADYYEAAKQSSGGRALHQLAETVQLHSDSRCQCCWTTWRIRSSTSSESSRSPHGISMSGVWWRPMHGFVWRVCKSGSDKGHKRGM